MTYRLLIQYPEKNPQDQEDFGNVDLDKAIEVFNKFNWEKQFKKIERREELNLTSQYPEFIFQNVETAEELTITGTENGEYEIFYTKENKIGSEHITEKYSEKSTFNSVQDIIIGLYQQELEAKFEIHEENSIEKETELGKYFPLRYFSPILQFLLPLTLLISICIITKFEKSDINSLIYFLAAWSLLYSPFIFIIIQYLSKPKIKSAILKLETKTLQINYVNDSVIIKNTDIHQLAYTYCTNRIPWHSYANISIILKNKTQHFLTTTTFSKEELEKIIETIDVNIYRFETSLQFLKTKDYSIKPEMKSQNNIKKEDLEILYSDFSDKQLNEIIENPDDYLPIAVEVARKELLKRKDEKR